MQFYSVSFLRDMYEVVAHVSNRYPAANLYAVGWSLGANILVRYLGQVTQSIHFVLMAYQCSSFICPCIDLPCIFSLSCSKECYGELVSIFKF